MQPKHLALVALVLVVALAILYSTLQRLISVQGPRVPPADSTESPLTIAPTESTTATPEDPGARLASILVVESPAAGSIVSSPLTVRGRARGPWYFEAEFPVRLLDGNGAVVAATSARSQSEWTTPDFVPFAATLEFVEAPATETGTIVLEKNNPSGLTQHADSLRIPIRFR